jgi:hypothetical protein
MLLSFHKFPSPWSAPAAKSGHFAVRGRKQEARQKVAKTFCFAAIFDRFTGKRAILVAIASP